jgi:Ca2+-binding RTX toxin-like protein
VSTTNGATFTISDNDVENLTLLGTANINGTGNTSANVLTGNSGNNTLNGGGGTDTASYTDATAGVTVSLSVGGAQNTGGAGTDTLISIENLTGSNQADTLTGNSAANVLTGGGGNDTLNGGSAGNDTLVGGAGNDTYVVDHAGVIITESNNAGTDTVQSSVTTTLSTNVENLTLTGTGNVSGTGNTSNNVIVGNSGNNALSGGGGTDTITGGAGQDTITSGAGNDTIVITATTDTGTNAATRDIITDFSGAGIAVGDIINLSAIDANINNNTPTTTNDAFTFMGTGAFTAAGQIRYQQFDLAGTLNDYTLIEGNVGGSNGNAADFSIQLSGLLTLGATDFVL